MIFNKMLATLGLALLPALGGAVEPVDIQWDYIADLPVPSRSLHAAAALNGSVYVVGGWDGASLLSLTARYDEMGGFWEPKVSMFTGRRGLAAAALDGKIYAIGGRDITGASYLIEAYDPFVNMWTNIVAMDIPRSELVAATANGKIYAIGGFTETGPVFYSNVEEYDKSCPCWNDRAMMNGPRAGMAAAVVNEMIYVIGGYFNGTVLPTVEEYNPFTNTWTHKANMPTPRRWLAAAAVDGKIYAIGGADDVGLPLSVVEEYDPASNSWTRRPDIPDRRYGHTAVAVNGRIVVSGGFGETFLASVLRGTPIYGQVPEKGRVIVAPNRLDPLMSSPHVKFFIRGDPFGMTGYRVYNEVGALMVECGEIFLDQDGVAEVDFDGKDEQERRLATGLYWVLFRNGGVEDRQPFIVARKRSN